MTETAEGSNRPSVSVVQLAGGALAALSAAVVASTLGVEGTILGAALGSIVATAGGTWYSWSIERTHERLRTSAQTIVATARSKTRNGESVAEQTAAAESTAAADGGEEAEGDVDGGNTQPASGYEEVPDKAEETGRRPPWRKLAIGAIGAFLIAMAAITVFELATGQPLAATVGSADEKGTSISPQRDDPAPAPATVAPTESPSAEPTGSSTPEPTATAEPTPTSTGQPTPTPAAPSSPARATQTVPQATPNG